MWRNLQVFDMLIYKRNSVVAIAIVAKFLNGYWMEVIGLQKILKLAFYDT